MNRRSPVIRFSIDQEFATKRRKSSTSRLWQLAGKDLSSGVIEQRDLAVWAASALLAIGMGWSRYAKAKARNDLLRQLAAMDPEVRRKMLSRYNPRVAMELRQELLERFRIMC